MAPSPLLYPQPLPLDVGLGLRLRLGIGPSSLEPGPIPICFQARPRHWLCSLKGSGKAPLNTLFYPHPLKRGSQDDDEHLIKVNKHRLYPFKKH